MATWAAGCENPTKPNIQAISINLLKPIIGGCPHMLTNVDINQKLEVAAVSNSKIN